MKKKMALLLVFAMVVTTSITVPFVSYADSPAKDITSLYGAESVIDQAADKTTDEATGVVTYSAEYTYTSKWNSSVVLYADDIQYTTESADAVDEAVVSKTAQPLITVTDANGQAATSDGNTYSLAKGGKYTISLEYALDNAPATEISKLSLRAKASTTALTLGTTAQPSPVSLTDIGDKELWYEVNVVDTGVNKGLVVSLMSGAEDAAVTTKVGYRADVYKGTTLLGTSSWDEDYGMMFECPLVAEQGTYYVKLSPNDVNGAKDTMELSATAVAAAEIDVNEETPTVLEENVAKTVDLYSFANRDGSYYWYKFVPTITGTRAATYEINFDFLDNEYGEINVQLYRLKNISDREAFFDEGEYADAALDSNTFYVDLNAGSTYFLELNPTGVIPCTEVKVTIKPHKCEYSWFVSDAESDDGQEISYGCPCNAEDSLKATCILNAEFKNVAYKKGTSHTPEPVFTFSDWWLAKGETKPECDLTDCYIVSYKDSKKKDVASIGAIGKYTATVSFYSDSSSDKHLDRLLEGLDSISATVKVVPAGTSIKSISAGKKAFTVKWKKQSSMTTGYQIRYSTSSSFKSYKTVTVTKNTATSKKVTKLKSKKKYYVKVRTYKTVSGVKYYSAWSGYKKVTTKK